MRDMTLYNCHEGQHHVQAESRMRWDPDADQFPLLRELPPITGAPQGAAWFWGETDNIGRLNLLTPRRVRIAAEQIKTGELVRLDLPLSVPNVPAFGREPFQHSIKEVAEGVVFDDLYTLNTQSGTQWDGFRHFAHLPTKVFYNGATREDIVGSGANDKCSIHHWSTHGIAGRGILLDYRRYAETNHVPYDPFERHPISLDDLHQCATTQGIDIRPEAAGGDIKVGDILFIRSGFVERYQSATTAEQSKAAGRPSQEMEWAGIKQEEAMVDWLHDCYFAAVVGDAPTFEVWPSQEDYHLHEHLLALWGVPIGEMWDLEGLASMCRKHQRWSFFMTSAPANVFGGVGSHANATAIF